MTMSSDDLADADLEAAADDVEDIDEDRSRWDKAPYWAWLLLVFGGATAIIGGAIATGRFDFAFTFTGTVDAGQALEELLVWGVRIFLFVTLVAALVVAPGDYLAAILRFLDGISYNTDDEE